jgi:hypothetical protein
MSITVAWRAVHAKLYAIMPLSIIGMLVGVPSTASIVPLVIDDVIVLGRELTANGMNKKVMDPTSRNPKY